jgi:hypothetical protein
VSGRDLRIRRPLTGGFRAFAFVSSIGWVLDLGLTMWLVQLSLSPFSGSLVGAVTGVSFVYFVSRLMLLTDRGIGGPREFGLYVLWQVFAISAASAMVAIIAKLLGPVVAALCVQRVSLLAGIDTIAVASGVAKTLVTPLTLMANYLFLGWLTGHGARRMVSAGAQETR